MTHRKFSLYVVDSFVISNAINMTAAEMSEATGIDEKLIRERAEVHNISLLPSDPPDYEFAVARGIKRGRKE